MDRLSKMRKKWSGSLLRVPEGSREPFHSSSKLSPAGPDNKGISDPWWNGVNLSRLCAVPKPLTI